ncbi:MAG: hypothetical protein QXF35_03140 [Candidatus Bilamarchaeaceae archaeon]
MSRVVIVDTNFFLLPYQNKIDIFRLIDQIVEEQHKYIISKGIIKELEQLAENKGKTGAAAKLGLKILSSRKDLEIIDSNMRVDNWVEKYAKEKNAIVCTNDKKLKNKLKQNGIQVITTKGKDWLGFV